jgi:hypothetical protein
MNQTPPHDPDFLVVCRRKIAHPTREAALRTGAQYVYRCVWCGSFHAASGKSKPSKQKRGFRKIRP